MCVLSYTPRDQLQRLDLSTSAVDKQKSREIRKVLRRLVDDHYDFHLSNGNQTDATMAVFRINVSLEPYLDY